MGRHQEDISLIKKGTLTLKGTGKCKPCHSEYSRNKMVLNKANKNPGQYVSCEDCDMTFSKYVGRTKLDGTKQELKNCPYCNSENFYPYCEDII